MRVARSPEVRVPRIQVSVEMDQGQRPETLRRRAQHRQRNRVVAADRHDVGRPLIRRFRRRLDLTDSLLDPEWSARDVARVGHLLRERLRLGPCIERTEHPGSGPDRSRPEARAGPVHDTAVEGNAEDRHLGLAHRIQRRQAGVRGRTSEPGHLHRVDRPDHLVAVITHRRESTQYGRGLTALELPTDYRERLLSS